MYSSLPEKIIIHFIGTRLKVRHFDWCAYNEYYTNREDFGFGASPTDAINDYLQKHKEKGEQKKIELVNRFSRVK
ncbi:MAG: hypothetical protein Q8936_14180 [Bacillota bacterium]|nr:hypothetical protein [Bacillota bacterium]